jgi:hypothetical protein
MSQYLADRRRFERAHSSTLHEATINEAALNEFEERWKDPHVRLKIIPGKEALSMINQTLQADYNVSITPTSIIDAMLTEEVHTEMKILVKGISHFASTPLP